MPCGGDVYAVVVAAPFVSRISLQHLVSQISPLRMRRLLVANHVALAIAVAASYYSLRLF